MSKIHEALKKAQQERAMTISSGPDAGQSHLDPTSIMHSEAVATIAAPHSAPGPPVREKQSPEALRFDSLVKNCVRPTWHLDPNLIVFSEASPSVAGAEQFRTLRTRLMQMRDAMPLKKVQVTSAVSGEGKTFVATNLAQAFARQRDRRVLLIDGDLRRSMLHLPLGAPSSPGLSDYLRGEATENEVIQHGQEGNLCFIPAGNAVKDPNEILSNGKLSTLLDRMSLIFDWIILDSPPCLPVADASVLANACDGVLLVVRAASTPLALAQKARQELQGKNVIGVVLNAVEDVHSYGGYYYGGYESRDGADAKV